MAPHQSATRDPRVLARLAGVGESPETQGIAADPSDALVGVRQIDHDGRRKSALSRIARRVRGMLALRGDNRGLSVHGVASMRESQRNIGERSCITASKNDVGTSAWVPLTYDIRWRNAQ